eukprot:CCRYP_009611-RE/>CCRYP_009611-RE protein AED:0.12 eAED:0.12 QI:425/1/1/1/1/0.93/15/294/1343
MTIVDEENPTSISEEKKDDSANHDGGFLSFLQFIQGRDNKDKNAEEEEGDRDPKDDVHSIDEGYQSFLSFLRTVPSPAILASPRPEEKRSTFHTDPNHHEEVYDADDPYYPTTSDSKVHTTGSAKNNNNQRKMTKPEAPVATLFQVFSFLPTPNDRLLLLVGTLSAILNGLVYPFLAWLFSNSFSSLGAASQSLDPVRTICLQFLGIGAFAFLVAAVQNACFLYVSARAADCFKKEWFASLLRQDAAFHDVHSMSGMATALSAAGQKMRRGLGAKLGQGVQFGTTFVGGIVFSFWSSWRVALVILAALPFKSFAAFALMQLNQNQTSYAQRSYTAAGATAYSSISSIRTVLSLNAVPEMIRQYASATHEAYLNGVRPLFKIGLVNGSMLGSFMLLYAVLTLYGSYLLYSDVEEDHCDPSDAIPGIETCTNSGPEVFGAMLGVAFAAQGLSQVGNSMEALSQARSACAQAMLAIDRTLGSEETVVAKPKKFDGEEGEHKEEAETYVLPPYEIDSSSRHGLMHSVTEGEVTFENVKFSYPTRRDNLIFDGFDLTIQAGKTVALVGPSGGGKSTTIGLIERFYDPISGSVKLDGVDLKDINVNYLRSQIGYVGQEPALFATTIEHNIRYGKPDATREEIIEAAKKANAHDFITSLPDGYLTQVGDKGGQLSGGQKQRIAIARVLVGNPKLLLLDEATSALDSESELVVQEAIEKLLATEKRTTIIIAHRLTTIRNADVIVVISGGKVVEMGTHNELMEAETGHYRALVHKQENTLGGTESEGPSRSSSEVNLAAAGASGITSSMTTGLVESRTPSMSNMTQLRFNDVRFAYPTRPKKPILDRFMLSVKRGETLALVGPSGGGKSTVMGLIERFYDPDSGSVEFEGVNIKELNLAWYRDQISIVSQEPTLFGGTIARNIAYGCPGASDDEIKRAAISANAHQFIMNFPKGYDTDVGESGAQLSGGQKQRIAIARALVKNPKILLLDEATSALDSDSERIVQEALDKLMEDHDRTTVVIAHRLSTIRKADRIAFIAGGRLREIGSHDELMAKPNGRYKRLVDSQKRQSTVDVEAIKRDNVHRVEEEDEDIDFENEAEALASKAFNKREARNFAAPEVKFFIVGGVGALCAGGVYPAWGILFAKMIGLLFYPALPCNSDLDASLYGFATCDEYYSSISADMKGMSFKISLYWLCVIVACFVGNILTFYGFGYATERINKRIRDMTFSSLMRQEIAFFDKRSVGSITSQLQDDASFISAFSGEPVRTLVMTMASVFTGVVSLLIASFVYSSLFLTLFLFFLQVISMIFMWPFALLSLAVIPIMVRLGCFVRGWQFPNHSLLNSHLLILVM